MLVSVAVPSFQQGRFLDACLGSLARQTHRELEVLIADGGSTDESLEVIGRYTASDPRFRLVSRSDAGQADALRKAFAEARGDVLGWLNSDDCYLHDRVLERACAELQADPVAGLVSFGGSYLDADGRVLRPVNLRYHPLDSLANLPWRASVLQPATFWRREVMQAVPLRAEFHYAFDAVFFWEAWRRFGWIERDEPAAGYRLHGDNKSLQVRPARIRELASFERLKFGPASLRAAWLALLAALLRGVLAIPVAGRPLARLAYLANNALAFATFYRWPGI